MQTEYFIEFKTLRHAYKEVGNFLSVESSEKGFSLHSKICHDLGLWGDDNLELLEKFAAKYNIDLSGFDYSKHFESESEIFHSGIELIYILFFPFFFIIWIIRNIKYDFKNWKTLEFYPNWGRRATPLDLTFGDLICWYLTKSSSLRNEFRFISAH